MAKKSYADKYLDCHNTITIILIEGNRRKTRQRFTFNWSKQHWKNHYSELGYIPNIYWYKLKDWKDIIRVANGTDPITFALLYMNDSELGEHIPFVAKLLVKYGIESVRFEFHLTSC